MTGLPLFNFIFGNSTSLTSWSFDYYYILCYFNTNLINFFVWTGRGTGAYYWTLYPIFNLTWILCFFVHYLSIRDKRYDKWKPKFAVFSPAATNDCFWHLSYASRNYFVEHKQTIIRFLHGLFILRKKFLNYFNKIFATTGQVQ